MSRIVPNHPDEGKISTSSFRAGEKLLAELDLIAEQTNNSRNEVILYMLRWAIAEWKAEKAESEQEKVEKKGKR